MAATEQQVISAYNQLTPEQQSKAYSRLDDQSRQWIDNYNASLNNNQDQGTNLGNWKYWDTSADRQEQIVNNLNEAYQQDPSRFQDWNTFAQNFNYNYSWRSDKERETMKSWYEDKMGQGQGQWWGMDYNDANNTDYFLSQLINGQTLGGTWAAATAAYNRYKDYQSLSGMTPEQIASAVSSNSVNPVGQSMIDLKNYSPALYAQVQSILNNKTSVDDINSVWTGIYDGLTKSETNSNYTKYNFTDEYAKSASVIKQYNESLYKKIEGLGWDTAAYVSIVASMLQNPLIQANKDEIENIEWEINKVQNNIWTISDTARAKLWSEAPEDLVSAYISQQTKELQNQLRTLNNSLLVAQGKLDNQLSEVDILIEAINQGLKTYWEDWTKDKDNYQYISASKYQDAGYFDKSTGQFYKLGETPDTNDYTSEDPARLQEIEDRLYEYANSDDVYVFRDRSAFNNFFKYSQRSAAQKKVLDDFWNANGANLKSAADAAYKKYLERQAAESKWAWGWGGWWWGWEWGWGWTTDKIKQALMKWVVSFDATSMKKNFWVKWWQEKTTNDTLQEIWKTSTPDEMKLMVSHLSTADDITALVNWYLTWHGSEIQSALDSVSGISKAKKRKEYVANLYTSLWISTKATDKRVLTLLKRYWYDYTED